MPSITSSSGRELPAAWSRAAYQQGGKDKVLLLEAGGSDRRFWIRVPVGYGRTFGDPRVNWMYRSEPDPALARPARLLAARQGARRIRLHQRHGVHPRSVVRFRRLGGRSAIPAGATATCCRTSRWPRTTATLADPAYVGHGGPIHISDMSRGCTSALPDLHRGLRERGLCPHRGLQRHRAPRAWGSTRSPPGTVFANRPPECYLRPALGRSNLEPAPEDACAAHPLRRKSRRGCRLPARGSHARGARPQGRHSLRRDDQYAAAAAAFGHRRRRLVAPARDRGVGRTARPSGRNLQDHLDLTFLYRSKVPTLNDDLYPLSGKLKAGLRYLLTRRRPARDQHQSSGRLRTERRAASFIPTCSSTSVP